MENLIPYFLGIITNVHFFFKTVKSHGQKVKYQHKDLITSNTQVKYQSFSTHYSKLKFSKSKLNSKVIVTIFGTQVKHHSSRSHCSKVICKLNVFNKDGQTPRSQGQNGWYPLKGLVS